MNTINILVFVLIVCTYESTIDIRKKWCDYANEFCVDAMFYNVEVHDLGDGSTSCGSSGVMKPQNITMSVNINGIIPATSNVSDCNEKSYGTCKKQSEDYKWCKKNVKCSYHYARFHDFTFSPLKKVAIEKVVGAYSGFHDNPKKTDDWYELQISTSTTESMSYTKSKGTSTSLSFTATATAPPPFDGIGLSRSLETQVSTTESHTSTESTTVTFSEIKHLSLPANTTIWYQTVIFQAEYTGDWTGVLCMDEYGKIWCVYPTNGHNEWFIPMQNVLGGCNSISGKFTGINGSIMDTKQKCCHLGSRDESQCSMELCQGNRTKQRKTRKQKI